jgi:hypothetical protein
MIRHFDLGSFVGRSLIFSSTLTTIMKSFIFLVKCSDVLFTIITQNSKEVAVACIKACAAYAQNIVKVSICGL